MQEIISRILEGNFDYENGSLEFSCTKIELTLKKGERQEGAFRILSAAGQFTNGSVTSSDLRMECLTPKFTGCNEEISYCFHGETLEEGDVVKGNFYIVSNQGEYYLPFVVSVAHVVLESPVGSIRNLFHFANLAKSSWPEAVRLFYSPDFGRIFTGSDAQYLDAYRALAAVEGREQNVEEFLIHINKKQRVEFLAEEEELEAELPETESGYGTTELDLSIVRNGWGYTKLFVEYRGDFLFTEKTVLTDDDFLGNYCRLPVFIDGGSCRRGRNYGQITLYNSYVSLTIPVTARCGGSMSGNGREMVRKGCVVRLMEYYQAFRTKKMNTSAWLKKTHTLVDKLAAMDESDISAKLFQAQVLITEESFAEAGWILDHVSELLEEGKDDTLLAYYLYLTTLIHRDLQYVGQVTENVEAIYRQDKTNWRVGWLLQHLSSDYHNSATSRWLFLEKQFETGCHSPVLYIEALLLVNNNPELLRKLEAFERQVLMYGVKQELLRQEVVEQMLYLIRKVKEYSPVLFKLLTRLYRRKSDVRLLQEICTLLIKGAKTGSEYFTWYSAGVEAQLRITNLYEYYMMSLNLKGRPCELSKGVLMYFSYQNNLDYERSAYLYDYILQHRDKLGEIYETYRPRMERFVVEQIMKGHINRNLANLYSRLLRPDMVDDRTCRQLSRLLFAHNIRVEDERLRKVYVYQPGSLKPAEYALTAGEAWVPLYGNDYTLCFEDAWDNRFTKNVEYTTERLMRPGKFLHWLLPMVGDCPELDLYLCSSECEEHMRQDGGVRRAMRVAVSAYADEKVKKDLHMRLLQYFSDNDDVRSLDEYIKKTSPDKLTAEERSSVVKYMMQRGNYQLAEQWMEKYGPYFVDVKILVRLLGQLIERENKMENPMLLAAAMYVFERGKYDSVVLEYLCLHYRGMTRSMRDIWKAARSFETDCYRLTERILVQMLYTGAFVGEKMEIFRYYISQGPKAEIEEAFLAQCCYDYFVRERVTEREVFSEIQNMYQRGESVQKVCKLAFLKYFAENPEEKTKSVHPIAAAFLKEFFAKKIHLDFFREFREIPGVRRVMDDKTIVEYHAAPQSKASIHYVILHESGESGEYIAENMREVYGGVFFKEFILFFGERLQYYITEKKDGEEQLTESGTLQKSENSGDETGSYHLINDIVISKTLQDFDTLDDLLEEYYKKEFMNRGLFELK